MLHVRWDRPGPGLEPMSPALAGGFLTTVPPGKPVPCFFLHFADGGKRHREKITPVVVDDGCPQNFGYHAHLQPPHATYKQSSLSAEYPVFSMQTQAYFIPKPLKSKAAY